MAVETDKFKEDYKKLKAAMDNLGFFVNTGNFAKFSKKVNGVDIYVSARIATQKPLYQIGSKYDASSKKYVENVIIDDIFQYQVWAEKNGNTLTSISGGGKGSLDVASIKSACTEIENNIK